MSFNKYVWSVTQVNVISQNSGKRLSLNESTLEYKMVSSTSLLITFQFYLQARNRFSRPPSQNLVQNGALKAFSIMQALYNISDWQLLRSYKLVSLLFLTYSDIL